jgi:hypothetical protein
MVVSIRARLCVAYWRSFLWVAKDIDSGKREKLRFVPIESAALPHWNKIAAFDTRRPASMSGLSIRPPKVDKKAKGEMEVLTKNAISDVFKIDPRSRDLELIDLLTPVAVLVSLKRRVALYSVDQIREIIANSKQE